jgi:hypothetical protein
MGIFSKILPLLALGVGILFLGNALSRPASATLTAGALGETGSAFGGTLSSIGTGAADLGSGVGKGLAGLFQPFWEVKNLLGVIPSPNVAGSANVSVAAQQQAGNKGSSTITWSSGTSASVPSLSAAARSYYSARGVSVT